MDIYSGRNRFHCIDLFFLTLTAPTTTLPRWHHPLPGEEHPIPGQGMQASDPSRGGALLQRLPRGQVPLLRLQGRSGEVLRQLTCRSGQHLQVPQGTQVQSGDEHGCKCRTSHYFHIKIVFFADTGFKDKFVSCYICAKGIV